MPQVANSGSFSADNPKRGPGRPKGSVNKITADIKSALLQAFDELGGVAYLKKQAKENPQAFMTLIGKVLPTQTELSGPNGGEIPLGIEVRFVGANHGG